MEVFFYPIENSNNKYINNIKTNLESRDITLTGEANGLSIGLMFKTLFNKEVEIFHFNWILNIAQKPGKNVYIKTFIVVIWLKLLKVFNKKIVWTMHNVLPHDGTHHRLALWFRKQIVKLSDRIIIHSWESKDILEKEYPDLNLEIMYIPHGNYINSYPPSTENLRGKYNIDKNTFVYLFTGQISHYKNVNILIEAFKEVELFNSVLLILGWVPNKELKKRLLKEIGTSAKIIFEDMFIPDKDIVKVLNTADILVFPYDKYSFLNSGSMYLSFSYKKTVIIPDVGCVKDIEKDFLFKYNYHDRTGHKQILKKKLNEAYNKLNDREIQNKYGKEAYEYVVENHSWDDVAEKLAKIYYQL